MFDTHPEYWREDWADRDENVAEALADATPTELAKQLTYVFRNGDYIEPKALAELLAAAVEANVYE
jgi:hypothetical protein